MKSRISRHLPLPTVSVENLSVSRNESRVTRTGTLAHQTRLDFIDEALHALGKSGYRYSSRLIIFIIVECL